MDDGFTITACTLPTSEKPFRAAEFDALVASAVRSVETLGPTTLLLHLVPEPPVAAQVAGLMTRETACCDFFSFTLTARVNELTLEVSVPVHHRAVMDAIVQRIPAAVEP